MIFCKSSLLEAAYRPMDAGLILKDGKRLFGANKTWKGFFGMIAGLYISYYAETPASASITIIFVSLFLVVNLIKKIVK